MQTKVINSVYVNLIVKHSYVEVQLSFNNDPAAQLFVTLSVVFLVPR